MSNADLIARLEALTEPDREVDRDIADALGFGPDDTWERRRHEPHLHSMNTGDWIKGRSLRESAKLTASRDAVVALKERLLPNAYHASGRTGLYPGMIPGSPPELYWAECGDWGAPCRANHDHEPIALLIATLKAHDNLKEANHG